MADISTTCTVFSSLTNLLGGNSISFDTSSFGLLLLDSGREPDKDADLVVLDVLPNEIFGNGYSRKTFSGIWNLSGGANGQMMLDAVDQLWFAATGDITARWWVLYENFSTSDTDRKLIAYGLLNIANEDVTISQGSSLTFKVSSLGFFTLGGCSEASGVIPAARTSIIMNFCGTPASASYADIDILVNGETFNIGSPSGPTISGTTVTYNSTAAFPADVDIDWVYTAGSLTVGGVAFPSVTIRVEAIGEPQALLQLPKADSSTGLFNLEEFTSNSTDKAVAETDLKQLQFLPVGILPMEPSRLVANLQTTTIGDVNSTGGATVTEEEDGVYKVVTTGSAQGAYWNGANNSGLLTGSSFVFSVDIKTEAGSKYMRIRDASGNVTGYDYFNTQGSGWERRSFKGISTADSSNHRVWVQSYETAGITFYMRNPQIEHVSGTLLNSGTSRSSPVIGPSEFVSVGADTGGDNLLTNTTDWSGTLGAGLAPDYWVDWALSTSQITTSIVTGNGFTSDALRVEESGTVTYFGMGFDSDNNGSIDSIIDYTTDKEVNLTLTYRSNCSVRVQNSGSQNWVTLPINTGNAITRTYLLDKASKTSGTVIFRGTVADGWFEIDDVRISYSDHGLGVGNSALYGTSNGNFITDDSLVDTSRQGNPLSPSPYLYCTVATQNKCTNYNLNPTDTTNLTKGGDAASTLTLVADVDNYPSELGLIGNKNVFKLDNSSGTANAWVDIGGTVGNTNIHSYYCWARGSANSTYYIAFSGASEVSWTDRTNEEYEKIGPNGNTPSSASDVLRVIAEPGGTVHFIGNVLTETIEQAPIIEVSGAANSVNASTLQHTYSSSYHNQDSGFVYLEITPERNQYLLTTSYEGLVSISGAAESLISVNKNGFKITDGTNSSTVSSNFYNDKLRVIAYWNSTTNVLGIGCMTQYDSAFTWGTEQSYDGAFATTSTIDLMVGSTFNCKVHDFVIYDKHKGQTYYEDNFSYRSLDKRVFIFDESLWFTQTPTEYAAKLNSLGITDTIVMVWNSNGTIGWSSEYADADTSNTPVTTLEKVVTACASYNIKVQASFNVCKPGTLTDQWEDVNGDIDVWDSSFVTFVTDLIADCVQHVSVISLDYIRTSKDAPTGSTRAEAITNIVQTCYTKIKAVTPSAELNTTASPTLDDPDVNGRDPISWINAGIMDYAFDMNYGIPPTTAAMQEAQTKAPAGTIITMGADYKTVDSTSVAMDIDEFYMVMNSIVADPLDKLGLYNRNVLSWSEENEAYMRKALNSTLNVLDWSTVIAAWALASTTVVDESVTFDNTTDAAALKFIYPGDFRITTDGNYINAQFNLTSEYVTYYLSGVGSSTRYSMKLDIKAGTASKVNAQIYGFTAIGALILYIAAKDLGSGVAEAGTVYVKNVELVKGYYPGHV